MSEGKQIYKPEEIRAEGIVRAITNNNKDKNLITLRLEDRTRHKTKPEQPEEIEVDLPVKRTDNDFDLIPLHLALLNQRIEYLRTKMIHDNGGNTTHHYIKIHTGPLRGQEYSNIKERAGI